MFLITVRRGDEIEKLSITGKDLPDIYYQLLKEGVKLEDIQTEEIDKGE